jgi:CBS domain-containing protein
VSLARLRAVRQAQSKLPGRRDMNISDILRWKATNTTAEVVTIAPSDSVTALLAALAEHNIGALVVVDGTEVAGVVSERDVVRQTATLGAQVLEQTVDRIMSKPAVSCTSNDSIDSIAATMTERRIRHMPVIDDGRLAGIVSIGDVVSHRIRQLEIDRGQLEQYISG